MDVSKAYTKYIGQINLRHVYFDHTKHPIFKRRNPNWQPGQPEDWFHTPALTTNAGIWLARGHVLGLFHPEVMHSQRNFEVGLTAGTRFNNFIYGPTYLGTQESNNWLKKNWPPKCWPALFHELGMQLLTCYDRRWPYWYTSFVRKEAAVKIKGVDFIWLDGVAGEDDDFRDRLTATGCSPMYNTDLMGFHQDHSHETESQHRRDTNRWAVALARNREIYKRRKAAKPYPTNVNNEFNWHATECITKIVEYKVGQTGPGA
jgi:hypothetical protein